MDFNFGLAAADVSQLHPASQPVIQQLKIGDGEFADNFHHESFFNGGELRFDAARHVQSRRTPFFERKIRVRQHRRNGDEEQVRAIAANDDGRTNLAAGQIRERNRKKNDVIS